MPAAPPAGRLGLAVRERVGGAPRDEGNGAVAPWGGRCSGCEVLRAGIARSGWSGAVGWDASASCGVCLLLVFRRLSK